MNATRPLAPIHRFERVVGCLFCGTLILACSIPVRADVSFEKEIQPIIESACLHCHNADKAEGDLRLDSFIGAVANGDQGPSIMPGNAKKSPFFTRTILPAGDDKIMPPDGPPLDESQTSRIREWINQGAKWPKTAKLQVYPRIDFVMNVKPILETDCVSCHSGSKPKGDLNLSTHEAAFSTGSDPPIIKPYHPEQSTLYTQTVVSRDDPTLMPPFREGGPLPHETTETLRLWISQGAVWPKGIKLTPKGRLATGPPNPDDFALVQKIRDRIVAQAKAEGNRKFADYSAKVPKTGARYHMVAIKGGDFLMGSPKVESGRQPDEGPQTHVEISPFWLGKYEVTWDEFEPFMITKFERFKNGARKDYDPKTHSIVDAVTGPTRPYADMTFGMGKLGYPAICMTQHAANKYCEWLSAQTGHFYRLPTEAEWEYACRAGTTTAYSFGNDPSNADHYAWYIDDSDEKSHKIGQKKPNPWGLFDMHGNVAEWTADQYVADYFQRFGGHATNPYVRPKTLYPRSVRGGSWNDEVTAIRSAARRGSDPSWKQQDPQLPKSIWYLTDAPWVGFRIARPQKVPSVEEMYFYWNSATGKF
ncbi:MAG TPA: SUMF1/EgtB/PvdO family nonheme iron enzyme [Lacipirellulaceae bacterium]|nr:SUMF1/EgtB/PvdO family nonheme iron enzyme [Lacipirellulaceae bacterium]